MSKIERKDDTRPLEVEKISKKKKNKTNKLQDIDDGDSRLNAAGDLPKKKGSKQQEKKMKSELNEDGDVAINENGNMGSDGNLQKEDKKKRERESTEDKHLSIEKAQTERKEQCSLDEIDGDPESRKEKKMKLEDHDKEPGIVNVSMSLEFSNGENVVSDEVAHIKSSSDEDITNLKNIRVADTSVGRAMKTLSDGKADKKKKKIDGRNLDSGVCGILTEESGKGGSTSQGQELVDGVSKVKPTVKTQDGEDSQGSDGKKSKNTKSLDNISEEPKAKCKSKKVSFSGKVEVFPPSDTGNEKPKTEGDNLVRGQRFTPEEDEIIKQAVLNYIKSHELGEEGLTKVLNCRSYRGVRNCWKEIGACLPHRPHLAIYYRAHILFERAERREWTGEEIEFLQKCYEKHGNNWKMVAEELGKSRIHVKDKWRRIKALDRKGGRWTQEEYQSLYDMVNLDLQTKVLQEKKSKHGMLRDNIPWSAISDKLATRSDITLCRKWYNQLTSSFVGEKKWSNADDYRLISALYDLDAACVEDVDWDALLEHRSGDVCRTRWNQMVLHIGHHGSMPFSEQVEILSQRYRPDLAETREAWDNKPYVQ